MFDSLLNTLIASVVWIVANVVYLDMKRKGIKGFTRLAAFWAGTPTTWITFFAVDEGTKPTFQAPVDDDVLLKEVRRDRALRSGSEDGVPEADETSDEGASADPNRDHQ